jgi:hypothetical protein
MKWTKTVVDFESYQIKVYVNEDNTRAVIFPLFGRYFGLRSDVSALDMAVYFIFFTPTREVSYLQYLSSQEDTSIIFQEAA